MNVYKVLLLSFALISMISCKEKQNQDAKMQNNEDIQEFKISLAQWSFNKAIFGGEMTHFDFISKAAELGFDGVEYVSAFFKDKVQDKNYLDSMNTLAAKHNLKQVLIMVDLDEDLGSLDEEERLKGVEGHYVWIDAAQYLGCHAIRVNLFGKGSREDVATASIKSLKQLCAYAKDKNINILVENHGGLSSDAQWLTDVISQVEMENCGTLPDFGNFCVRREEDAKWGKPCVEEYDKYQGITELMPQAKAVSAKSYDFGELGYETTIDYCKMLNIVKESGYSGYIGVEYEGERMSELDGVVATKKLIQKCLELE